MGQYQRNGMQSMLQGRENLITRENEKQLQPKSILSVLRTCCFDHKPQANPQKQKQIYFILFRNITIKLIIIVIKKLNLWKL